MMYSRWTDKGDLSLGGATAQGTWKIEIDRRTNTCNAIQCTVNAVGTTLIPAKTHKRERRRNVLPPGTWLAMVISVLTLGLAAPCRDCKSRSRTMDRAGWLGLPFLLIVKVMQFFGANNHGNKNMGRIVQR